jgi:hypothetical protein
MRIPTRSIPQADRLSTVLKAVEAVGSGASSYQGIARAIGLVERQGRYYRLAAELLGLIERTGSNQVALTKQGKAFLAAAPRDRSAIARGLVLNTDLFQRTILFLEAKLPRGATRDELTSFVESVTAEAGETMMPRRVATITSWLQEIEMVHEKEGRYLLLPLPQAIGILNYTNTNEPLLPKRFDLQEYREPVTRSPKGKDILYLVDAVQRERANNAHRFLVNLVAERIRLANSIPRQNALIDLAAKIKDRSYIFEMKSINQNNAHHQVRLGVSQLYEYRYRQNASGARLVLVIQSPLGAAHAWLQGYLIRDRDILLAWDGNDNRLDCPSSIRDDLSFLF